MQLCIITRHEKNALVISTPAVLQKGSEKVVSYSNRMSMCNYVH